VADGDVVITVGDNGCGIPEPLFERIFEPFFTTREVGKGAGQGLAICYKFVNGSLGGSITVASTEGAGSTFTLRLPAMAREEAQIEPPVETA
jgi:signal transduction histidine kinase